VREVAVLPLRPRIEDGFRELVEANEAAVHGFLRRRVQDPGRAEDLTQEVFLRAWRHADQYDPQRADVRAWLFGIARNLVIDAHRADAARPRTATSCCACTTGAGRSSRRLPTSACLPAPSSPAPPTPCAL
jgi:DNA-directed RNA polymerase specialized sigma24 family protein